MPRSFTRRGRILPGPLRAMPQAESRGPVPVMALAVTAAVVAAGFLLLPERSPRLAVAPPSIATLPDASSAGQAPEAVASTASDVASPVPAAASAASPPPAPEPVRPAIAAAPASVKPAPSKVTAAKAPAKPVPDLSLFRLDGLPVLETAGVDLDPAPAPSPVPKRAASRKPAASNRAATVATSGEPIQP